MSLRLSNGLHRLADEFRFMLRATGSSAGKDAADVVDFMLSDRMFAHFKGKNDLAVINGLVTTAALWTATHCEYTGQDFDETAEIVRSCFESGFGIAREHIEKKQKNARKT